MRALSHGDIGAYLHAHPVMGPFATIFQAPFSLLGGSALADYRWASFGCLLALAGLGWYLAAVARRRGAGSLCQALIAILCVLNPLTLEALAGGHPEELLTAALAVGATVVASEGHAGRAAILLGLAIAAKQWAVIAIFPVLMALPARRLWAAAVSAAIVAALTLPGLLVAPSSFLDTQGNAASGGRISTIWSVWYPVSPPTIRHLPVPGLTNVVHEIPGPLQSLTHPLIVATVLLLPLALWAWRGRFGLDAERALALLALLALLRCVLDPVDNLYYHVPLLVALLGWDALSAERLPLRGLAATAVSLLFWRWSHDLGSLTLFNAVYLAVLLGAALAIAAQLVRRGEATRARPLSARDLARA
ncbi:MAG TPA: glycosyltransferase 87 family protein [Solirubrobacterales bacterium]|nr:glycosyltransferase 87 family protein [Solirubrobacterales bacterium]